MNNNGDSLLRLLVPAAFLIFWALSQIYNRQASAAQRARSTGSRLGPRPGADPVARSTGLVIRPTTPSPAARRTPSPQGKRANSRAEGVVIVDQSFRNIPTASILDPVPTGRRGSKPPKAAALGAAPGQRPAQENLSRSDSNSINQSSFNTSVSEDSSSNPNTRRTVTLDSMREALSNPERIREAILLQVILSPPVSMNKSRNTHGKGI